MGFSMLSGDPVTSTPPATDTNQGASLTPPILFAASPGTITGVITISAAHTKLKLPVKALAAIAIAMLTTWPVMLLFARMAGQRKGGGFIRDTVTRLMGLIVLSMGVQFALSGYRAFMN
jgi:multiple antibiotic resistance protein